MPEDIRLIVWDLDDTFWRGSLGESTITQVEANKVRLIELARRGIISSLCSKNDPQKAEAKLRAEEIWDYFVFPSLGFEPKGPRIAALVEAIQLRPETVLFIDDNPSNLEEARYFLPGLQIASHDFIPDMLADPRLVGRADPELVRLKQYQTLQRRKSDATLAPSVADFLRASDIRVTVEHEVLPHLDRAIELVNRTNQLNFTKKRLSDDPATAIEEIRRLLAAHDIQAGLVKVRDRYGDHGYAGFYVLQSSSNQLLHFCFSCRIFGMGVETWLFRRLRRPRLNIVGEVLTSPVTDPIEIDWIHLGESATDQDIRSEAKMFDWIAARGGCDLSALTHYFGFIAREVLGEFNVGRGGFDARVDHSIFLRYALDGIAPEALAECTKIGYRPEDFQSALFAPHTGAGLWLLSFWIDSIYALYRHKQFGFLLPWARPGECAHERDARNAKPDDLPLHHRSDWISQALETLKRDYDYVGLTDEALFKENLRSIIARAPAQTPVVLLKRTEYLDEPGKGRHVSENARQFNFWITEIANEFPQAHIFDVAEYINSNEEAQDWLHFDRTVYYRLFCAVKSSVLSRYGA
jgi:FkbH-like protein